MVDTQTTKKATVEKKGSFAEKDFFKDSWDEWDQAMQDVVSHWDKEEDSSSVPANETRRVYRKICSSKVNPDDMESVSCTEEDNRYKMMIDVKEFAPSDISVKVVDDAVVVEGKVEKKEANSVSTQKFVRRFLLPSGVDVNGISSALSKDGVLTVACPKLAPTPPLNHERSIPISQRLSSTSNSRLTSSGTAFPRTPLQQAQPNSSGFPECRPPERSEASTSVVVSSPQSKADHWSSFNEMVEESQREMEEMFRKHTVSPEATSVETAVPVSRSCAPAVARPLPGLLTRNEVIHEGSKITEKKEREWQDSPSPGTMRNNRSISERSTIKGEDGQVLGNRNRYRQQSESSGARQHVNPDGSKSQTFTKTYETRHVSTTCSNVAKKP